MKFCVFCGSLSGANPSYVAEAQKLGEAMAKENIGLVYGGGTTGLMGTVAKACAINGGEVHGIIPAALVRRERKDNEEHDGTTDIPDSKEYGRTTVVDDMHTRKRMMGQECDAFVALPGGYGTLEELMEVVTWFQLSIHNKPIVIFNIDGFYDGFLKFVGDAVAAKFVSEANAKIIIVATTVDEVMEKIKLFEIPEGRFNLKWSST